MTAAPPAGPVRVGVAGCADIAVRRMLPAIAAAPDARLTAVASRTPAKARATAASFGGEPVVGYERLLDRDDVDAVYVPLPVALHAEWAERALLAGKHVLAEKPLTGDYEETRRLLALARARGLVLAENYMFVHHTAYGTVRDLVARGTIGEPRALTASFTVPPRPSDDIRYRADLGGGALLDIGVYPVRLAQLLLGPGLDVLGATLRHDRARGVDLGGAALLHRPDDGVTAQLAFGMEHAYTARWELLGSEGSLALDRAYSPPADHEPVLSVGRGGTREELRLPAYDQAAAGVAAFVRAVRAAGAAQPGPWAGEEESRRQARLIEEIRRAARVTEI